MSHGDRSRTVRQLGGEIWVALRSQVSELEADWRAKNKVIEITMAVLARHAGCLIENDPDLPVEPLPRIHDEGS